MSILLSKEITRILKSELESAKDSVQIITAYCKESAIKQINSYIRSDLRNRKIMIRYRLEDLIKGSSDLSVARFCLKEGWSVFFRFDLHAKTYLFDNKRVVVTSANLTNRGLGFGQIENLEIGTVANVEDSDLDKISGLFKNAVKIDDVLLSEMERELSEAKKPVSNGKIHEWGKKITGLFNPEITTLFSHEFPVGEFSANGYIDFLDQDFNGDYSALKNAFRWSNVYLWLTQTLRNNNNCMYFGELTSKLHEVLVSDPKPYRKEVKELLSNLLNWVEKLNMESIVIDRPNYSQRVLFVEN